MAQILRNPFPRVSGPIHTPRQHRTESAFEVATEYRELPTIKHPEPSECHSYPEYLHLGLLEGDSSVDCFVPQAFLLWVGGSRYKPDGWFRQRGRQIVFELRPGGEMPDNMRIPLQAHFLLYGMEFRVISNESVLAREIEALNWIEIVKTLQLAREIETQALEQDIYAQVCAQPSTPSTLGDWVDARDREGSFYHEVAVFRLLHRGMLVAGIKEKALGWDTEIRYEP